jgi:hypothetical protein
MSTDSNKLFNYLWIFILITSQSFASREIEIVSNGGIVEWVTETSYKRDPETGNPQIDSLGRADLGYSIAKTFRGTETFYLIGEYVTLKPTADDGYQFTYWLVDGLAKKSTGVIYPGGTGSSIFAGAYDGITFDLNNSTVGKVEALFSKIPDPQKVDSNLSTYEKLPYAVNTSGVQIVSNGGIVEWVTETSYKFDPQTGNPQIDSWGRPDLGYSIAKTFRGTETFYFIGDNVTLKPTADDGYQFTYWLVDGLANESTGVIYSGSPGSFISAGAYDGITFDLNNSIVGKVEAFFSEIPDPQKVDTNSSSYKEGFSDGVISVQNDPNSYELISKQDYDNKMSQFPSLTLDASPYTLDWYYQPNRGWMWTKKSCFPYIFDQNSSNWLFFEDANENPRFYEYESKSWILLK